MGKPKDIAWGQVDFDSKNDSVVWCKHCKAKLLIGSGRNQTVSGVKRHLKAQHYPVFSSLYPSKTSTNEDLPSISGTKRNVDEIDVLSSPITNKKQRTALVQQTLPANLQSIQKLPFDHEKSKVLHKLCFEMITKDKLPFNFVNGHWSWEVLSDYSRADL